MNVRTPHRSNRLVSGRANQPEISLALPETGDVGLVGRKGELHLLCVQGMDRSLLAQVHEQYYSDTSLDPIPSLRSALVAAYVESGEVRQKLLVALVLRELEVFAVGTEDAAIWLVGHHGSRELLPPGKGRRPGLHPAIESAGQAEPALYSVQWRLTAGDALVITTREAAQKLRAPAFRRILRGRRSARGAARTARRVARASRIKSVPVSIVYTPGFSPVPELGALQRRAPQPTHARVRLEREPSPIWPALGLAVVAVGITLWIKRPTLSRESLSRFLVRMLTPAPTATAPSPPPREERLVASSRIPPTATRPPVRIAPANATTPQPEVKSTLAPSPAEYSPPELLTPKEGESVHTSSLALSWASDSDLEESEYFDVRLWRIGTEKRSIAWTKDLHYIERLPSEGWHSWTVVVVRGQDGVIEEELTDEPKPIDFRWHPSGAEVSEKPTSTPIPPTRITPGVRPTRGTPDLANESGPSPSGD